MLSPSDKIIVGLSGGADSVALTHYLRYHTKHTIIVCHINHCLRGAESDRDMGFVSAMCDHYGIPCYIYREDIAAHSSKRGISLEQAGREVRYKMFEDLRKTQGANKIATAHTLTDSVETLLINLTRGTGIAGLCGIPPVRGKIIRPLIGISRDEVEFYCQKNELAFVVDSTNLSDTYTRNIIRNQVMPTLRRINPAADSAIARTITLLEQDRDYLDREAKEAAFFHRPGLSGYPVENLLSLPIAIRSRIISGFLKESGLESDSGKINRITKLLLKGEGREQLSGGLEAVLQGGRLKIAKPVLPLPYFEADVKLISEGTSENNKGCKGDFKPTAADLGIISRWQYITPAGDKFLLTLQHQGDEDSSGDIGKSVEISNESNKEKNICQKVYKNLLYLAIDYDKIKGKLVFRQRQVGDEIQFAHRAGNRRVKELFIDEKLTPYDKSRFPLLCDDEGVLAIYGFGIAARVSPDEGTKRVLTIALK